MSDWLIDLPAYRFSWAGYKTQDTKHPAQRELTHFLPGDLFPVLPKNGIISMDTDTTDYGCLLTANKVGFVVVCLFVRSTGIHLYLFWVWHISIYRQHVYSKKYSSPYV